MIRSVNLLFGVENISFTVAQRVYTHQHKDTIQTLRHITVDIEGSRGTHAVLIFIINGDVNYL